MPRGSRPRYLDAHAQRFRARLTSDGAGHAAAAEQFRALGIPFWLAVAQLEHGEWLAAHHRPEDSEPALTEAEEIFARLAATPWLERTRAAQPRQALASSSGSSAG